MSICRYFEGAHAYLLKWCRGTCSSVGMLKGYMVRERLGTHLPKGASILTTLEKLASHVTVETPTVKPTLSSKHMMRKPAL